MIQSLFSFFFCLFFFLACETDAPEPKEKNLGIDFNMSSGKEVEKHCYDFSFQAMGTLWRVVYCSKNSSMLHDNIRASMISLVSQYDETFSNWSQESELGKVLEKGLSKEQCPSPLFMKGLNLGQELFQSTGGVFDISLGEGVFSSLAISSDKSCFTFTDKAPQKLDFNGFVKGMATGAVAVKFYEIGLRDFYINAGDGNLAYRVSESFRAHFFLDQKNFPFGYDRIYFLSQSRTLQEHNGKSHQHIFGKKEEELGDQSSQVICSSSLGSFIEWPRLAGVSDAYSTALTLKKDLKLPLSCYRLSDLGKE